MLNLYDSPVNKTPVSYSVEDKEVICSHCGNNTFVKSTALLNTKGMTFLGLDWANKLAVTLICDKCGQVLWFLKPGT